MEDSWRREFIKGLIGAFSLPSFSIKEAFASKGNVLIKLPPLPLQETHIVGKKKGGRVLIVGGIHGNEPGAYKAADILRHVKVKRGELFIAPRMNFVSILANQRGYNGDMNRKFSNLSPKDPDYVKVVWLKNFIEEVKPDIVLTLHDGFGFHSLNPRFWGQCIVIDDEVYKGIELGKIARYVSKNVNKGISNRKWKIPVYNTRTFDKDTKHPEQRKSLTYYCLKNLNIPAICLETSKQMPNLETKVVFHLKMLKEFFDLYDVTIEPDFQYLISNVRKLLYPQNFYSATVCVNGRIIEISSSRELKVPPRSTVQVIRFNGTDGTNGIFNGVNKNYREFSIRRKLSIDVKDDFKKKFNISIIVC